MAEIDWGWLSQYEAFGRLGDNPKDYEQVAYEEPKTQNADYTHAAHGMFYATNSEQLWQLYQLRGAVLMQLRFDGVFGFPGGLVEPGEDPAEALNREMEEEMGLDVKVHKFTATHHVHSCLNKKKNLILHFFAMEVTMDEFSALEAKAVKAPEYGIETFGVVRVPLFTMGDGLRGLPAFLTNQFVGNARQQLLIGVQYANLLTPKEVEEIVKSSSEFLKHKL